MERYKPINKATCVRQNCILTRKKIGSRPKNCVSEIKNDCAAYAQTHNTEVTLAFHDYCRFSKRNYERKGSLVMTQQKRFFIEKFRIHHQLVFLKYHTNYNLVSSINHPFIQIFRETGYLSFARKKIFFGNYIPYESVCLSVSLSGIIS